MSTHLDKFSSATSLLTGFVLCIALSNGIVATSDKPNIIIIMADDLVGTT